MTRAGALESPTTRGRRWPALAVTAVPLALIVAASSPSVAQALPRFFFPAVAVVGAVATALGLVRALRRRSVPRIAVALIGFVVLAVLPCTRLIGIMTASSTGPPRILVGFGDWIGGEGYPRPSPHRGIDVKAPVGSDVLAAADGRVVVARDHGELCGLIIVVFHEPHGYRTVYCHSATLLVHAGEDVRRGQRIGIVGTTGQRAWPGYEHVHLELQRGADRNDVEDPMRRLAGCFDARASYPTDRLVLTYPVPCRTTTSSSG